MAMAVNTVEIPSDEMTDFCNFLRETRIGTTQVQSQRSVARYQQQHGQITADQLIENFSQIISDCIIIETEIFNEIMNQIRNNWMEDLLGYPNRASDFPSFSNLCDQALLILDRNEPPEHNLIDLVRLLSSANDGISFSMKQAAKSRAGSAFQNYMELFFDILGIRYQRQATLRPGEVLDLVFPNLEYLHQNQESAIIIECQTTLKDRYRLSLGKTNEQNVNSTKFIGTLTGANLITTTDHNDLPIYKINEIRDNNWRIIALRQVAENLNSPTVISFEQFVNEEYPRISAMWN